jgi:hypothetical protein
MDTPIPRKIKWIWSNKGECGKSTFCKYMVINHEALVLCGSATNIKNGICKWMERNPNKEPKIIILDYPRSRKEDFISYAGLEEIKNGCFFSPKFEGGMCVYNTPHVIDLANSKPEFNEMSSDRFDVMNVDKKTLPLDHWLVDVIDNDESNILTYNS